jgi:hypothetical protein
MAPYSRFVRSEQSKLSEAQGELQEINKRLGRIKVIVEEL